MTSEDKTGENQHNYVLRDKYSKTCQRMKVP